MRTDAARRLLAWATGAALGLPALPACTVLLDTEPVQCRDDASCARFPNAICDVGNGVCVPRPPLPDASLPPDDLDAHSGVDVVAPDAAAPDAASGIDGGRDTPSADAGDGPGADRRDEASAARQDHANGSCPDLDHDDVVDCSESLLDNPDFGVDGTGWTPEAGATQLAPGNGAADDPVAGALAVVNANWGNTDASTMAGSSQCVTVQATSWYAIYAEVRIPSDQAPSTSAGVGLLSFATHDCSGPPSALTSPALITGASGDGTWQLVQTTFATLTNSASLSVRLVVMKAFQQAPAQALFDNVLFKAQK